VQKDYLKHLLASVVAVICSTLHTCSVSQERKRSTAYVLKTPVQDAKVEIPRDHRNRENANNLVTQQQNQEPKSAS
jgi:hypothetical protein